MLPLSTLFLADGATSTRASIKAENSSLIAERFHLAAHPATHSLRLGEVRMHYPRGRGRAVRRARRGVDRQLQGRLGRGRAAEEIPGALRMAGGEALTPFSRSAITRSVTRV